MWALILDFLRSLLGPLLETVVSTIASRRDTVNTANDKGFEKQLERWVQPDDSELLLRGSRSGVLGPTHPLV